MPINPLETNTTNTIQAGISSPIFTAATIVASITLATAIIVSTMKAANPLYKFLKILPSII